MDQLTQDQKEMLLKALAFFAVQSNGKVEMLLEFAKYAAEGFDQLVDAEVKDGTITFKRKEKKI